MSTPPALGELLLDLNRAPAREPAARALLGWLDQTLRRSGVRGDRADRIRSRVTFKLVELSRSPRLAQIDDAEAYARQMVRCALIDLLKEDARHISEAGFDDERCGGERGDGERGGAGLVFAGYGSAGEKEALEESVHESRERARALLRRAFAGALAKKTPRYHAGLRATFEDLCALALDQASLRTLLSRHGPVGAADLTAAYKRHERMRESLSEAVAALAGAGRLTRREAAQAEECLSLLLRPGPKKRGKGGLRQQVQPGQPAPLRLEKKQRAPGREPKGALRGAA
jgi:hypothetical protein